MADGLAGMSLPQQEELRRLVWRVVSQVDAGCYAEPALAEPISYLRDYFLRTPGWMPGLQGLDDPDDYPRASR